MPYMKNGKRDYATEYRKYHADEKQKKRRAARNNARRRMEDQGKVRKGDGKDVDHKNALSHGGSNSLSNLRVVDANDNRSYPRTKAGHMKRMSKAFYGK